MILSTNYEGKIVVKMTIMSGENDNHYWNWSLESDIDRHPNVHRIIRVEWLALVLCGKLYENNAIQYKTIKYKPSTDSYCQFIFCH